LTSRTIPSGSTSRAHHAGTSRTWRCAGWSADPAQAAELPTRVDSGFGIVRVGAGYALATRRPSADLGDGAVLAYLAGSPAGPFRADDSAVIYQAPETGSGQYVYQVRCNSS
jgi:hypothetical protein